MKYDAEKREASFHKDLMKIPHGKKKSDLFCKLHTSKSYFSASFETRHLLARGKIKINFMGKRLPLESKQIKDMSFAQKEKVYLNGKLDL